MNIYKSGNGKSGNEMRGMIRMREIRMGMDGNAGNQNGNDGNAGNQGRNVGDSSGNAGNQSGIRGTRVRIFVGVKMMTINVERGKDKWECAHL